MAQQSQLLTQFFAAVDEFNNCKSAADYRNLAKYYGPDAQLHEVDVDPKTGVRPRHDGRHAIIAYLAKTQPERLPRFWPTLPVTETPANSDTATNASLDGTATYFDCTTNPPAPDPDRPGQLLSSQPFTISFHFEFTRPTTASDWLVTKGNGKKIL